MIIVFLEIIILLYLVPFVKIESKSQSQLISLNDMENLVENDLFDDNVDLLPIINNSASKTSF